LRLFIWLNNNMKEIILKILREIKLNQVYTDLCLKFDDFDKGQNLNRKDIEPIIKSFDSSFKYIARDRTFIKETQFKMFKVRFFIGYRGGIIDFSYLIWKEGENQNYYQGRLASLSKLIDTNFDIKVKYQTPIASSLDDFTEILTKILSLYQEFEKRFKEQVIDIV